MEVQVGVAMDGPYGPLVGDQMDLVPPTGERLGQFGRYHATPTYRGITDNSYAHKV